MDIFVFLDIIIGWGMFCLVNLHETSELFFILHCFHQTEENMTT